MNPGAKVRPNFHQPGSGGDYLHRKNERIRESAVAGEMSRLIASAESAIRAVEALLEREYLSEDAGTQVPAAAKEWLASLRGAYGAE